MDLFRCDAMNVAFRFGQALKDGQALPFDSLRQAARLNDFADVGQGAVRMTVALPGVMAFVGMDCGLRTADAVVGVVPSSV